MREGFAELLATVDLNDERAIFGEPNRVAVLYLRRRGLMPMETLFSLEQTTKTVTDTELMTRLYAQSWAVSHYLKFALPPEKALRFEQFRNAVAGGVPTTVALKEQLGLTPEQLTKAIKAHIHSGDYRTARVHMPATVKNMAPPKKRAAVPGEAEAWLGDWALENDELGTALQQYTASLQKAPDNVFGLVGQGRVLAARKQFTPAMARLRQAAQPNPQSGWAQLYLGVCLLDATSSEPFDISEKSALLDEAIHALKRVTELMPEYPPAYVHLARAYGATRSRLPAAMEAITKARDLDPSALNTYLMSAAILAENGQAELALDTLDSFVKTVPSQSATRAAKALAEAIRSRGSAKLLDALYQLRPKLESEPEARSPRPPEESTK
jgi:tetratricopeptide (TPR) repeat protein